MGEATQMLNVLTLASNSRQLQRRRNMNLPNHKDKPIIAVLTLYGRKGQDDDQGGLYWLLDDTFAGSIQLSFRRAAAGYFNYLRSALKYLQPMSSLYKNKLR
ncbi:hypothetical protein DPMN_088762 [Dreissena polymorpha]|uniref:Uncharacterized protein n=1 Tax=Dreissena polymorpha TaxID=45954 RepID=A0A9D4KWU3_DREPO|nr:hypothetical protein DPMN_088762 [Dreissena polymorpha]